MHTMRPQRTYRFIWPAILTVAAGTAAIPATTRATSQTDDRAPQETTTAVEPEVPPATEPPAPAPPATTTPVATTPPTGTSETGPSDTPPDTGPPDAGPPDAGPPDARPPEPAGPDATPDTTPDTTLDTTPDTTAPVAAAPAANASDATTTTLVEDGSTPATNAPKPEEPVSEESETDTRPEPAERTDPDQRSADDVLDRAAFEALPDGIVRPISFPVLGPVSYGNHWGNCRDGCSRLHVGTDLTGVRMQPLLAAVDGTVTRVRHANVGTAGAVLTITGSDGWRYNYFHLNDDTPGTHDGAASGQWRISPRVSLGGRVHAGQVIAYMGDSGNAAGVAHLHFEMRLPDGRPTNPYPSLVAAQRRQACALPGSLAGDPTSLSPDVVAIIPLDGGGRWLIDRDGDVFAEGSASRIAPTGGNGCAPTVDPAPPSAPTPTPTEPASVPPAIPTEPASAPAATPLPTPTERPNEPQDAPAPVELEPVAPPQAAPADTPWTVARGESLWTISQQVYGVSETAATASLVNVVFEHNQELLWDPNVLDVGMILQLPALDS
jgi:murein DD-endopeptidase MepM/ murein hydrolase activator NlpD